MKAGTALRELMTVLDEHRWDDIEQYLHPDFVCHLVHTGERFSRTDWIRFNAEYPDFDHLQIEELVAGEGVAACRSHVTSRGEDGIRHFGCASFVRMEEGKIHRLTEVWTDVEQQVPPGHTSNRRRHGLIREGRRPLWAQTCPSPRHLVSSTFVQP